MPDEVTFIDLACLLRLTPDTTLEKFGSAINASIFDASNLAGTLKQKSLIDFSSYYPGPNTIMITEAGKALMAEADAKAATPFDSLDQEVLFQISGGKRIPTELQNSLNIRPKDLALRLYKLFKQGMIIYELKSGGADIQLTESGYLKAKSGIKPQATAAATPVHADVPKATTQPNPTASELSVDQAAAADKKAVAKPKGNMMMYAGIIVVILILIAAAYYFVYLKHPI